MAVLILGTLLSAGCGSGATPAGTSSPLGPGTTVFARATALQVPPLAGKLLSGAKVNLTTYRGHVVVLNFWGSWCSVCQQEAPALSAAAQHFQSSGVRFMGVDVEDNTASAKAFMKNFRLDYPSFFDPSDQVALRFSKIIPVTAFPSTLVISPSGRVAGRIIGAVTVRNLTKLIEAAGRQSK